MGRYGYPQCYLAERGRAFLGYMIIMTGGLCTLMGILIITFSFVILGIINPYTVVIEKYTNTPYLVIYILCGVTQTLVNLVATVNFKQASRSVSREKMNSGPSSLHQLLMCTVIFTVIILVVCAITVGVQLSKLSKALGEGLGGVMGIYSKGDINKLTIDLIQMDFQCCGNSGPEDWYTLAWKSNKFLRESDLARVRRTGVYHVADVPFSCCDAESPVTPCQHEDINNIGTHGTVFDTLNEDGCKVAMLDYFKQALLLPAAIFLTCIVVIQMINLTIMRYLATSIENLYWASPEDPDGLSPGYLVAKTQGGGLSIGDAANPLDEGL